MVQSTDVGDLSTTHGDSLVKMESCVAMMLVGKQIKPTKHNITLYI